MLLAVLGASGCSVEVQLSGWVADACRGKLSLARNAADTVAVFADRDIGNACAVYVGRHLAKRPEAPPR